MTRSKRTEVVETDSTEANEILDTTENIDSSSKKKKTKKKRTESEHEIEDTSDDKKSKKQRKHDIIQEEKIETDVSEKQSEMYKKKMNKMFLSREERARRDLQRKLQTYSLELRTKGMTAGEVKKNLKKMKQRILSGKGTQISQSEIEFEDLNIVCKDCDETFTFSAKEQAFYKKRGFSPAVRCKVCINAKKDRMERFN